MVDKYIEPEFERNVLEFLEYGWYTYSLATVIETQDLLTECFERDAFWDIFERYGYLSLRIEKDYTTKEIIASAQPLEDILVTKQ